MKSLITRLLLATVMVCGSAGAQPVTKFIVPFASGGSTDFYVRLLASEVSEAGVPVIVENKVSGSATVAGGYVTKARPDVLTLFVGGNSSMVNNTVLFDKLPNDPLKDFAPVSRIGNQPLLIVGRTDLPYSNLKELVAYAKAKPRKINRGSQGAGSFGNLLQVLFERVAGTQMTHVPFNGDPPAIRALLIGSINMHGTTITGPLPHVQSASSAC